MFEIIYTLGLIPAWLLFTVLSAKMMKVEKSDSLEPFDIVMAVFLGLGMACLWPVAIPGAGVYLLVKHWDV